jgi:type II secretory pathway component PulL
MSIASDAALLFQLNQKEAQLDTAANRILTDIFPSAAGAADPWGQLQSRLQGVGNITIGGPDFIDALIVLADALDKSSGIKVDALNFRSGIIDLRLEAPAVENLDTFRQAINDSGRFIANIQSANPAGNVIKGRVQVKAQGT